MRREEQCIPPHPAFLSLLVIIVVFPSRTSINCCSFAFESRFPGPSFHIFRPIHPPSSLPSQSACPSYILSLTRPFIYIPHFSRSSSHPPALFRCVALILLLLPVAWRRCSLNTLEYHNSPFLNLSLIGDKKATLDFFFLKSISILRAIPPTTATYYCRPTHPFKFLFLGFDHLFSISFRMLGMCAAPGLSRHG